MTRYTGTILIADGVPDVAPDGTPGDAFDIENVKLAEGPVPVTWKFDPKLPIGKATLRIEGNRVVADVELDEDVEIPALVPAMGGVMETEPPKLLTIDKMALCEQNSDPRIEPLEPVDGD